MSNVSCLDVKLKIINEVMCSIKNVDVAERYGISTPMFISKQQIEQEEFFACT